MSTTTPQGERTRTKRESKNHLHKRPGQKRAAKLDMESSSVSSQSTEYNRQCAGLRVMRKSHASGKSSDSGDCPSVPISQDTLPDSVVSVENDVYVDYTLLTPKKNHTPLWYNYFLIIFLYPFSNLLLWLCFGDKFFVSFPFYILILLSYFGFRWLFQHSGMICLYQCVPRWIVNDLGFTLNLGQTFLLRSGDFPELGTHGRDCRLNSRMLNDLHEKASLNDFSRTRDNYGLCKSVLDTSHKARPYLHEDGREISALELSLYSSDVIACFLQQIYVVRKKYGHKVVDSDLFKQLSN